MFFVNTTGEILSLSSPHSAPLGYPSAELIGGRFQDVIHSEDRRLFGRAFRAALESPGVPQEIAVSLCHKDGALQKLPCGIFNLLGQPPIGAVAVCCPEVDASTDAANAADFQYVSLARKVAQMEGELQAVGHDFRESLRSISLFASLLEKKVRSDSEATSLVAHVIRGARRMSALFEGINSFVLSGLGQKVLPLELEAVLSEVLTDLQEVISSCDAKITWNPLPLVWGDELLMRRVFQNLISNSVKYRNGPSVDILVTAETSEGETVVSVKDNGLGIDSRYHELIFGLSTRLHGPERSGSGIGLAICKKIVEDAGGRIWVESSLGAGSTFRFAIPKTAPAPSRPSLPSHVHAGVLTADRKTTKGCDGG